MYLPGGNGHSRRNVVAVTTLAVLVGGLPLMVSSATAATVQAANDGTTVAQSEQPASRPNAASAAVAAKASDEPVEDLSARTETAQTTVNPDGTRTLTDYGSPVRVHNDDGSWSDVDFNLERLSDGAYEPKVSATDITIGNGGSSPAAHVAFDDGSKLDVKWPDGALPAPVVNGAVATYKIDDTMDLLTTVVEGGVSTVIRFNSKPSQAERDLALRLKSDGLKVAETVQGGLQATNEDGVKIGRGGTMVAWDSRKDAAGDPLKVVPVEASLITTGGSGFDQTQALSLSAPDSFLDDPTTVYPVTVDPTIGSVTQMQDTYVRRGMVGNYGSSYALAVGATSTNTNYGRAYLKFSTSAVTNQQILSSTLNLFQYYGYDCGSHQMVANPLNSAWSDTATWTSGKPGVLYGSGDDASVYANKGASGCPSGWTAVDMTDMVDAWAHGTYPNYGLQLAIPSAYETWGSYDRRFCSMDPDPGMTYCNTVNVKPYLSITYDSLTDSDGDPNTPDPSDASATAYGVDSYELEDLQAIAADEGTTTQQAVDKYGWQDDFAAVAQDVAEAHPDSFTYAEVGSGQPGATIGFSSTSVPTDVEGMVSTLPVPVTLRANLPYSESTLNALSANVRSSIVAQVGTNSSVAVESDPLTGDITAAVYVPPSTPDPQSLRTSARAYMNSQQPSVTVPNVDVSVIEGGAAQTNSLRGGVRIAGATGSCTSGFPAKQDGTSIYGLLTARHCPNSMPTYSYGESNPRTRLGDASMFLDLDHGDIQYHPAINGEPVSPSFYYMVGKSRRIKGVKKPVKGMKLCLFGRTTKGYYQGKRTCATVKNTGQDVHYKELGDVDGLVEMNKVVGRPGDSGGPWFYGGYALGIESGDMACGFLWRDRCETFTPLAGNEGRGGFNVHVYH